MALAAHVISVTELAFCPLEFWLTDVEALNHIYQCAKTYLMEKNLDNLMALESAIEEGECSG